MSDTQKTTKTESAQEKALTVGWLKRLIKDMDDNAPIYPDWEHPPADTDPAVVIYGFRVAYTDKGTSELIIRVGVTALEELSDV